MQEGEEQEKLAGKVGKVGGGRGRVVREAAKLCVQLLQKARAPSTALGLPVTPKQSEPSISGFFTLYLSFPPELPEFQATGWNGGTQLLVGGGRTQLCSMSP